MVCSIPFTQIQMYIKMNFSKRTLLGYATITFGNVTWVVSGIAVQLLDRKIQIFNLDSYDILAQCYWHDIL